MLRVPPFRQSTLTAILGIFIAWLAGPAKAQLPGRFMFGPDNIQIKQCNIDGSNCFNVVQYGQVNTGNPPEATQPSIASNGTIAFDAVIGLDSNCVVASQGICPPHVFLMDPDGTNIRQITFNPNPSSNFSGDRGAAISPDGTMVAFVASRNAASDGTYPRAVYVVNADGSGLRQVTPFSYDGNGAAHGSMQSVAWSSDSKNLAFKGSIIGTVCGTYGGLPIESEIVGTINVNGTGQTYRACFSVNEAGSAWGIDWSPDGTLIAYAHNSINFGEPAIGFIDLSGQGRYASGLTTAQLGMQAGNFGELCFSDVHCLHFSPDGTRIAYENNSPSDNPSFNGISTIKLDGTGRLDSFNYGATINNGMWWASGAALPPAAQFTLAPNPTQVWPGHSQQLMPTLSASNNTLILHTAASYSYTVDYGTSGCIRIDPYGLVSYGGDGNGSGTISAANEGLTSNSVIFKCLASPPCTFTLGSTSANFPASGGPSMVGVTTSSSGSCPWTASSNASWITITSGGTGSGNGMVGFSVAANTALTQRVGTITIADNTFTVTQAAPPPTMLLNRSTLNFGTGGGMITSPQSVTVTFNASGVSWTASSNQANITVSPASGTGSGVFQVTAAAGPSGMVTVTAPGTSNSPQQVQVNVVSVTPTMPFGNFDTPANNTIGIAGAVAVTGWALDSIEVASVGIWREPVPGEATGPNGLVFIGNANFVADARPDVAAAFPSSPFQYRGGWGYLMLTNFLQQRRRGLLLHRHHQAPKQGSHHQLECV
jgi:Viral BACON domain/WD40-like Beta Propeller Repeat